MRFVACLGLSSSLLLLGCHEERAPQPPALAQPAREARPTWQAVLAELAANTAPVEAELDWATERQRQQIESAQRLDAMLRLDPQDRSLPLQLARVWREAGFPQRALRVLGGLLAGAPDNPEALLLCSRALNDSARPLQAVAVCQRVLELAPSNGAALQLKAELELRLGEPQAARAAAEALLERNAFDGNAKLVLAEVAQADGDLERARTLLDQAVRDLPNSLSAHFRRASLLAEQGDLEGAKLEFAVHARLSRLDDLGLADELTTDEQRLALAASYVQTAQWSLAEAELVALLGERWNPAAAAQLRQLWSDLGRDVEAQWSELSERLPSLRGH